MTEAPPRNGPKKRRKLDILLDELAANTRVIVRGTFSKDGTFTPGPRKDDA